LFWWICVVLRLLLLLLLLLWLLLVGCVLRLLRGGRLRVRVVHRLDGRRCRIRDGCHSGGRSDTAVVGNGRRGLLGLSLDANGVAELGGLVGVDDLEVEHNEDPRARKRGVSN